MKLAVKFDTEAWDDYLSPREAPINSLHVIFRPICHIPARVHNAITASSGVAHPNRDVANRLEI
jgi:hypothetical protein